MEKFGLRVVNRQSYILNKNPLCLETDSGGPEEKCGKILEKVKKDDQATKSIIEFNNKIIKDDRVKNIILPIRDGLNIVRKN